MPARLEAPNASSLRKAQVRAALFRKSEPIRIGRFILLEPLGAGAMGEIYAAYDEQLDRKVALKLVRSGSPLTVKADERLLREAQTLAQVSHPNVVQIYEAGTYNGRLFIAMELVRGKTLTSWLGDAGQLPRAVRQREILRQFIAAGRGLEAAHAADVAHRDFKPDNVLVGDDGRVRVVDFGLARALGEEADAGSAAAAGEIDAAAPPPVVPADIGSGPTVVLQPATPVPPEPFTTGGATIDLVPALVPERVPEPPPARDPGASAPRLKAALRLTETGTVMGTPFFMAPEQMRGGIADLRSDQFSFCVALYHALYDEFPFSGRSLKELRDSMQTDEVEFASGVPVPAHIRRALHRGLSVDPAHRFPSMGELLAALSPRVRRYRGGIAAAGLLAAALGAALVVRSQSADACAASGAAIDTEWPLARQVAVHVAFLRTGLPFAEPAWQGVKARVDDYAQRWRGDAHAACQATNVHHTQSPEQLDRRMLCLDRGRRQLSSLIGELSGGAADAVEHAVEAAGALPELDACSRPENLLFGVAPPPAALAAEVAKVRDRLAQARTLEQLGHYDESLAIAREANMATDRLDYPPVHAEALVQMARALGERGTDSTRAEAEKLYVEALTLAESERHDQLVVEIWRKRVALALRIDAGLEQAHERWAQAYAWAQRTSAPDGKDKLDVDDQAELHFLLGVIYFRESEYRKAADEDRRAVAAVSHAPARQLDLSRYEDALAKALERLGVLDESMQLHERALTITRDALGAGHPKVIFLEISEGWALIKRGRYREARAVLEGALASMPAADRDSHQDAGRIHGLLSEVEYGEGRLDQAARHARESLQIYQRALSADHPLVAEAYTNLANVEFTRRNFSEALALHERALELRRRVLGEDHYNVGFAEGCVAETLLQLERYGEAMDHLMTAERIMARGTGREGVVQAWLLTVRGEVLVGQRKLESAIPPLERALGLFNDSTVDVSQRTMHALAMWSLARALHGLGKDPGRVWSLADDAHAIFVSLGPDQAHDRDAVAQFLAQLSPSPGREHPERAAATNR
ncbi:MAG TPA: serine/threonine-protein kinase [Kofleriaceae bacterium]|nr:serine/threonine-protein kinase [Kofleriaceae bacterium]